jgi:rhamnose utilization protein RhaD (predicted bifunctional aldolase and dehydrogenase)
MSNNNLYINLSNGVMLKSINGVIYLERGGINLVVIDKHGLMLAPQTPLQALKEMIEMMTDETKIKRLKKAVKDYIDDGMMIKLKVERD